MLRLLGEGLTNRQIGERLALAEKTVKNYTGDLLAKLGLQRRTQAAILATELRDRLSAAAHAGPRQRRDRRIVPSVVRTTVAAFPSIAHSTAPLPRGGRENASRPPAPPSGLVLASGDCSAVDAGKG